MYLNRNARRRSAAISRKLSQNIISTIAISALGLGAGISLPQLAHAGPDVCTVAGNVATCVGDQSDGITNQGVTPDFTTPPIDTLNVNNLTTAITPTLGTTGIDLAIITGDGNLTLNSDTGNFGIATLGSNDEGISVVVGQTDPANGNVIINSTGNITTNGTLAEGIIGFVRGNGNVDITSSGNITTIADSSVGIEGLSSGLGDITIGSTGNIMTSGQFADGILAFQSTADGDITIDSNGNITTEGETADGIRAQQNDGDGDISINNIGSISTTGDESEGISASLGNTGNVSINSTGDITTSGIQAAAIFGSITGNGDITVDHSGQISTTGIGSQGIEAGISQDGNINITTAGSIMTVGIGDATGIDAEIEGNGEISITNTANITTGLGGTSSGIFAAVRNEGIINITSMADINVAGNGISAFLSDAGNVTINSSGMITSNNGNGVRASVRADGNITTNVSGRIETNGSGNEGIDNDLTGNGSISTTFSGDLVTNSSGIGSDGITSRLNGNGNIVTTVLSGSTITTSGTGADGIKSEIFTDGTITTNVTGNIITNGVSSDAISAEVQGVGDINITVVGDLSTTMGGSGVRTETSDNGISNVSVTGNIDTLGTSSSGVIATLGNNGLLNANVMGTITTQGLSSNGVSINGSGDISAVISANITTNDSAANGVRARRTSVGNTDISFSGVINTMGLNANGIFAEQLGGDGNLNLTSTGEINTIGNNSNGISLLQSGGNGNISVVSNGNISTTGDDAAGIAANIDPGDGNINISSIGNISTAGMNANGIAADAEGGIANVIISNAGAVSSVMDRGIRARNEGVGTTTITNSGLVSGVIGINVDSRANNAAAIINNSGTITGTGGIAIDLEGDGNDVVNLQAGSIINGAIDFGNGNDNMGGTNPNDIDTLNIEAGFNGVVTFADAGGAGQGDDDLQSAPEIINIVGAAAMVNNGSTMVVVDPTSFAASSVFISDVSNALHNVLDNAVSTVDAQGTTSGPGDEDLSEAFLSTRFWIAGFGGTSETTGNTGLGVTDIDHDFGGLASGIETGAYADGIWGVFGGASNSSLGLQFGQGSLDVDSVFGGLYYKRDYGDFRINAAFALGNADHDSVRNTTGAASSTANFDGWFYSPSLTLEAPIDVFGSLPGASISGRINYTSLQLDGYTETGGPAPLTVGDRDISLFGARAQLNLPTSQILDNGTFARLDLNLGLDAQYIDSDNVNSIINIGGPTGLNFAADIDDRVSGFIGAGLSFASEDGMSTLSFSGEFQSDFDSQDDRATGEIRATFRF